MDDKSLGDAGSEEAEDWDRDWIIDEEEAF